MLTHQDAALGRWLTQTDEAGLWSSPDHGIVNSVVRVAQSVHDKCGAPADHVLISADLIDTLLCSADLAGRMRYGCRPSLPLDVALADIFDVHKVTFDLSVTAWTDWTGWKDNGSPIARQRHQDSNTKLEFGMRNCVLVWSEACVHGLDMRSWGGLAYNCAKWMPCSATWAVPQSA